MSTFTMKLVDLPPRLAIGATGDLPRILAFDVAMQFGFAFGVPGQDPISGSRFFTQSGKAPPADREINHARVFANAQRAMELFYEEYRPTHIAYEAPLDPMSMKGKSNADTFGLLWGIPANMQGCFYRLGIHRFLITRVDTIRKHFLDTKRTTGKEDKQKVFQKCRALGWIDTRNEPDVSLDRTDALAVWSFAEHYYSPRLAIHIDRISVMARAKVSGRLL